MTRISIGWLLGWFARAGLAWGLDRGYWWGWVLFGVLSTAFLFWPKKQRCD